MFIVPTDANFFRKDSVNHLFHKYNKRGLTSGLRKVAAVILLFVCLRLLAIEDIAAIDIFRNISKIHQSQYEHSVKIKQIIINKVQTYVPCVEKKDCMHIY